MKRFVILTVGKTHSGKTTFAKALEQQLRNSIVVDQDNHAAFINDHYSVLLPKEGPNTFKHALSQTILNYAVDQTDLHLILCNANRSQKWRLNLLEGFRDKGFDSILVYFDIPDEILQRRVAHSNRDKNIFRSAAGFEEVLVRQIAESNDENMGPPSESEADHFFRIENSDQVAVVIDQIVCVISADK